MVELLDFYSDLEVAKKGEKIVQDYLSATGWKVFDVSLDKSYQVKGVDFIIMKDFQKFYVEVKYDSYIHSTGNFCLENECVTTFRKGWFRTTQADFIMVVSKATGDIYIYKVSDMREYIRTTNKYKAISSFDRTSQGVNEWINYLVPIKDYQLLYPVQVIANKKLN